MKNPARAPASLTAALVAALATSGVSYAQEAEDAAALAKPESIFEIGMGNVSKDNRRFGQYTGQVDGKLYPIGNLEFIDRDDATGTWLRLFGRNLGYEDREMRVDHFRQGNWGYFVEYSQTPRYSPYTVRTGLLGINSNNQTISPVGLRDVNFKTERDTWTAGFEKFLWNNLSVNVRYRYEDKDGKRLFGRGNSGLEFLAEPISFHTQQLETTLAYAGERLQLSGGYYGTWFNNNNTQLNSFGGTNSSTTSASSNFQTIGLPPDNRSWQFHLGGGYDITPTTRTTFKAAIGRLQQTDSFARGFFVSGAVPTTVPIAPGIGGDLKGKIDTNLYQWGVFSRPMSGLTLRADLRYENRDDKTPIQVYQTGTTPTSTTNGENEPRSIKSINGKVEASYALPMGFRATGGVDYQQYERSISEVRIVSARKETDETSYRAELRRSLSETVNGALSFVHSNREGSDWKQTKLNGGAPGSNLMYPMFLADRERNKWKAVLDWSPVEAATINFMFENAKDKYTERYVGLTDGKARLYSIDGAYNFSETWQANAWYSHNSTSSNMDDCRASTTASPLLPNSNSFCPNTVANESWSAKLRNLGNSYGVGLKGKPTAFIEFGANLEYFRDRGEQDVTVTTPGGVPAAAFPDIKYTRTTLRLFGKYAIDKNASLRLQYTYDHYKTDDWTWSNFVYGQNTANPAATDGTTLRQNPTQNVNFFGLSYLYTFH